MSSIEILVTTNRLTMPSSLFPLNIILRMLLPANLLSKANHFSGLSQIPKRVISVVILRISLSTVIPNPSILIKNGKNCTTASNPLNIVNQNAPMLMRPNLLHITKLTNQSSPMYRKLFKWSWNNSNLCSPK